MAIDQKRLQTDQSYRDQLRDAGYFVGSEGGQVYAEQVGADRSRNLGGGGGGGPAPIPTTPQVVPQGFDAKAFANSLTQGLSPLFGQVSGFERDRLRQENDQFLAQLQLERDRLERLQVPELEIRRQLAQLEIEHTNRMDALQAELGRGQLDLQRGGLGLDYLKTAASMGGPADYFQSVDFMRGAQQRSDVPMFINSLRQNVQGPAFQAPGGQAPTPQTADNIMNRLGVPTAFQNARPTGMQPAPGYNTDKALGQIGDVYQQGLHKLPTGSLESLDQDELDIFQSGGKKLGYSVPAAFRQYSKSRVPQSLGVQPFAKGGIVTEPTLALIGEAGPEAVVPLSRDMTGPDQAERKMPIENEVSEYIRQAAAQRGIDPEVALHVAHTEGGFKPAERGTFRTGSSWWPFQLHYGGEGYEHFGTEAGLGNDFSAATGFEPGDPSAWRASIDFALDRARREGWAPWYGAAAANIDKWRGIQRAAR